MGRETGFEPATSGTTNRRSNQLSYTLHSGGTPGWTRTTDQRLRRPSLYPTELQALRISTPAKWHYSAHFSVRLSKNHSGVYMVGVAGFEPATLWSQTRCAARLRYTPPEGDLERRETNDETPNRQ